jgi:hypothetical protein
MNQQEYFEFHQRICEQALAISKNKNHDYSGKDATENPFANLEIVEKMGIASTPVGILTRITDKISRINSFIQLGLFKVADEKIEDTVIDAINYLILLLAWIVSHRQPPFTTQETMKYVRSLFDEEENS